MKYTRFVATLKCLERLGAVTLGEAQAIATAVNVMARAGR